jgi:hypothetical protein
MSINMYYIFCVCVCVFIALVIQHTVRTRLVILSSLACSPLLGCYVMSSQLDVRSAAPVKRCRCQYIYRTSNKRFDMKLRGLLKAG